MANVLQVMGDKEHEDFFRMNMDKHWSWFHQKLLQHDTRLFGRKIHTSYIMQFILKILFDNNILSHRKLTFDELKVVVKEI